MKSRLISTEIRVLIFVALDRSLPFQETGINVDLSTGISQGSCSALILVDIGLFEISSVRMCAILVNATLTGLFGICLQAKD
jgi:hypothetical protein